MKNETNTKAILASPTNYRGKLASVLDEKRRVVLPKHIAEELGLVEGSRVTFKKERDAVIMRKVESADDSLREIMSWNPKRSGRPKMVKEEEIKEIWEG